VTISGCEAVSTGLTESRLVPVSWRLCCGLWCSVCWAIGSAALLWASGLCHGAQLHSLCCMGPTLLSVQVPGHFLSQLTVAALSEKHTRMASLLSLCVSVALCLCLCLEARLWNEAHVRYTITQSSVGSGPSVCLGSSSLQG